MLIPSNPHDRPGPTRATSNFHLAPATTQASPKGEAKNKQITKGKATQAS